MSKYVKNLIADHLRNRLDGRQRAVLVNVIGLESNSGMRCGRSCAAKNIHLLVVKNSLAARAIGGHAAGADVRRRGRLGRPFLGRGRHRQPGQGGHPARPGQGVRKSRGPRAA